MYNIITSILITIDIWFNPKNILNTDNINPNIHKILNAV